MKTRFPSLLTLNVSSMISTSRSRSLSRYILDSSAMFYFLALNSGPVISSNDRLSVYIYPVTGIGFVLRDFSKVFSHTFRLDMAELT